MSLDEKSAKDLKLKGCLHCKGPLHRAHYMRKSRSPFETPLPQGWDEFYGLCCSKEGCRKRSRPLSVRFAGRSPHSAGVLLLFNLLRTGGAQRSVVALCKEFLISERTVRRWLKFWKIACRRSNWWRNLAGRFGLSGGTTSDLFSILLGRDILQNAIEKMTSESSNLWAEVRINVGDNPSAQDA
jgi:hypothetical protein